MSALVVIVVFACAVALIGAGVWLVALWSYGRHGYRPRGRIDP